MTEEDIGLQRAGVTGSVSSEGDEGAPPEKNDWTTPRSPGVPAPTVWPAMVALAVVAFMFGLLTSWIISALGLAGFAFSVTRWMEELNRDH